MIKKSPQQSFEEKYIKVSCGCWLWTAATTSNGYGNFIVNGKITYAHRFSYEQKYGQIPEGLQLDHLCRIRNCCNPDHVEPVTNKVNILRGIGITAIHAKKTHCPQGHPYKGDNLYINPKGGRECMTCRRQKMRKLRQRIKQQRSN